MTHQPTPLRLAETWALFVKQYQPQVLLLVDGGSNKTLVLDWCIDNEFEHIELQPSDPDEGEEGNCPLFTLPR